MTFGLALPVIMGISIGASLPVLTARDLSVRQSAFVNQYLRVIGDFERMADHAMNIAERAAEIRREVAYI